MPKVVKSVLRTPWSFAVYQYLSHICFTWKSIKTRNEIRHYFATYLAHGHVEVITQSGFLECISKFEMEGMPWVPHSQKSLHVLLLAHMLWACYLWPKPSWAHSTLLFNRTSVSETVNEECSQGLNVFYCTILVTSKKTSVGCRIKWNCNEKSWKNGRKE